MFQPFIFVLALLIGMAIMLSALLIFSYSKLSEKDSSIRYFIPALILISVYIFLTMRIYQSNTIDASLFFLRIQVLFTPLIIILYLFLMSYFTNQVYPAVLKIVTILMLPVPLLRFFSPNLLSYTGNPTIRSITLPWGEVIHSTSDTLTIFGYVYFIFILCIMIYIFILSLIYLKKKGKNAGWAVFVNVWLIVGVINDIVVESMGLNWVYLSEFSLASTIILIGLQIVNAIIQSSMLKQKLKDKESQISQLMQSSGAAIFALDHRGYFSFANLEFCRIANQTAQNIIDHSVDTLEENPFIATLKQNVNSFTDKSSALHFQTEILIENRKSNLYTTLVNTQDKANIIIGITTDISDLIRLQDRLLRTEKMAAIGQLVGGIAHDFNNMLAGIIGSTQLLTMTTLKKDQNSNELLELILTTSNRAADLTKQLLMFSRKSKNQVTSIDMAIILKDVISLIKRSAYANIEIMCEIQTVDSYSTGDISILQNVFLNLAINAVQAMPDGGQLTFLMDNTTLDEAYCSSSSFKLKPGNYLRIKVKDTGIGIPQGSLEYIFEPFYTTKEEGKGTGLGLAAVYGAIQEHNGEIRVESIPNIGTIFTILLPISQRQILTEQRVLRHTELFKATILIVDDEDSVRQMYARLLKENGLSVITAKNGREALEIYNSQSAVIDLVILDLNMPQMGGRETFLEIKKINPSSLILLISAFSTESEVKELIALGAAGFLAKPFLIEELIELLGRLINKNI